jgi:hypothetical protein
MPRYFFHLRDHTDEVLDPEGVELADLEAAKETALRAARDTMSHDMQAGKLDLRYRIDVEDDAGHVVHSIQFSDAFETVRA